MECFDDYYHDVNNKQAYLKRVKNSRTLNDFDLNIESPQTMQHFIGD